jgi:pyruvate dehydrogenase E2 component (dihydrolipoamide acetyltransferase)
MAVEIVMPAMEMAQESARLVAWLRAEGEYVRKGEPVMEIETDKVTVEIEAPGSGVLSGLTAQPGDDVPTGSVVAYLLEEGEHISVDGKDVARDSVPASPRSEERVEGRHYGASETTLWTGEGGDGAPPPSRERSPALQDHGIMPASPKARRLARESAIDLATIAGSGPNGAVLAADVLLAGQSVPVSTTMEQQDYTVVPIAGMRRTIADRVQASYQTAPHISLSLGIDMTEALRAFRQMQAVLRDRPLSGSPRSARPAEDFKLRPAGLKLEQGLDLTVTALLAHVLSRVLREHRRLNAHLVADEIREFRDVHLGVAVALADGLIVPVIHHADQMTLVEIQVELDRLVGRARTGTLTHDEVSGGTFTLSNLGMFGIQRFTAIVNPPQVGIGSAGTIEDTPVGRNGEIVLRPMMQLTINVDHRAVDGAVAAHFLQRLKLGFENTPSIVLV